MNVGKVSGNSQFSGREARGKKTDLFGPTLRTVLDRRGELPERSETLRRDIDILTAKNHRTTIDDEALAYLSKAAETRLREMLSSAVSVQQHRTTTSYLHPPPRPSGSTSKSAPGSSSSKSKPMWEVSVNNDPNAVIDVLNRQAKDAEREFRTSRMERLAKEYEMDRVRERQAALNGGDSSLQASGSGSGNGLAASNASGSSPIYPQPDIDVDSPGGHPPSSPDKHQNSASSPSGSTSAATSNAPPTFGGPRKVIPSKTTKKNPKDVTTDVQIKMSNATAMRSAGMGKKYSWMSSAPQISSPLSGNKKKGKKGKSGLGTGGSGNGEVKEGEGEGDADGDGDADADADGEVDAEVEKEDVEMVTESTKKRKSKPNHKAAAAGAKRRKKMPSLPPRRMIPTGHFEKGMEKLVPDDRALTVFDLVFSMEREKGGKGMGTSDEVVRRVMARPGGVWGSARTVTAPIPSALPVIGSGPGSGSGSGSGSGAGSGAGDKPK